MLKRLLLGFLLSFTLNLSYAQSADALSGLYRTYDNHGQARSIVKFSRQGNSWQGRIIKILPVKGKDMLHCSACKGAYKNKPLKGLVIIRGLQYQDNKWVNGTVLDIDSGKTYRCSVVLTDGGRTLKFSAYLGPFGKTINWPRVN